MDAFTSFSTRMKILIVTSALFLVTLSVGIFVFGENVVSHENTLIEHAKDSAKVDLLYATPGLGAH